MRNATIISLRRKWREKNGAMMREDISVILGAYHYAIELYRIFAGLCRVPPCVVELRRIYQLEHNRCVYTPGLDPELDLISSKRNCCRSNSIGLPVVSSPDVII